MTAHAVKTPTIPIPFHRLLKVVVARRREQLARCAR